MDFDHSVETITPDNLTTLTIGGTGALVVPSGTTAQRPAAATGQLRYNSDTSTLEFSIGSSYRVIDASAPLQYEAVAAAGTTQGTATAVTANVVHVTSGAANSGIILPAVTGPGRMVFVRNNSGNPIYIYPPSGATISTGGTNAGVLMPSSASSGSYILYSTSSTHYEALSTFAVEGSPSPNQILAINTVGDRLEYRTLTAGSGITITPAAGSFTIAATGGSSGTRTYTFGGTGTPTVGTDKAPWIRVMSAMTAVSASLVTKTAPSGGSFVVAILRSTDGGTSFPTTVTTFTLTTGNKVVTTTPTTALAIGDLLRVDITSVNGAADWNAELHCA